MTLSSLRCLRLAGLGVCLLGALAGPVRAQTPVTIGGQAFIDYYYQITAPDGEGEGLNGFSYRRLRVTFDSRISDAFSARARFEADNSNLGPRGPEPYVKDLFLTWDVGGGHVLRVGVTPPPAFEVADRFWGYRSLEKTLLDLSGVVSSRDFGVRANGPLGSDKLRYGLMVGNNNTVFPEDDEYKRVYGQLEYYPTDALVLTLASNYAAYVGVRGDQVAVSAMAGYAADTWRVGTEAFYETNSYEGADALSAVGVSAFGVVQFSERWGAVGRVDRVSRERFVDAESLPTSPVATGYATFGLVALVYRPHPRVEIMPNLRVFDRDGGNAANTLGRVTLAVNL